MLTRQFLPLFLLMVFSTASQAHDDMPLSDWNWMQDKTVITNPSAVGIWMAGLAAMTTSCGSKVKAL